MKVPSLRATVTTVAAAVVLVAGADLAAYAAGGNALLLGKANSAIGTTSLRNAGRGPALKLNNITSAPPLVVNSSKMVANLNANMVGGKTAAQLAGTITRFKLGTVGQGFAGGQNALFFAKLPKTGTYAVNITGLVIESNGTVGGSDSYTCLVIDKNALESAIGGGSLDYTKLYADTGSVQGAFDYGVVDYTNPDQRISNVNVGLGCSFNGPNTATFTDVHQLAVTFKPVSSVDKAHGGAIPLPRTATRRLFSRTR